MEDKAQGQGIEPERIKRILIRGANWVGDALMTTPALSCVRRAFPDASISILVSPWVEGVYRGQHCLDGTILYERAGRHRGAAGRRRLIRELRKAQFDMALLFPNSFDSALVPFLARIPVRVGYEANGRGPMLTHRIKRNKDIMERHQVGYYLGIPQSLGWRGGERRLSIPVGEGDEEGATELLRARGWERDRPLVAFAPGASYGDAKRWNPSCYAEVADALSGDHRAQAIIVGSRKDREAAQDLISKMRVGGAWDFTGATTLGQLAALLARCGVLITNDSGAMHVASATQTPVVALFGPTDPAKTSPYGVKYRLLRQEVDCSPCLLRKCPKDHRCMTRIEVAEVLGAASAFLEGNREQRSRIAVFLDRDGTINEEVGYLSFLSDLKLIPGAAAGIRVLNQHALKAVIVSNQSGVARGYLSLGQVRKIHEALEEMLGRKGAYLDGVYFCPHHPQIGDPPYRAVCDCRKPNEGMLRKAASDLGLDLRGSYVIGDHISDISLAQNTGMKSVLVLTGHGASEYEKIRRGEGTRPDGVCASIYEAIDWILKDLKEA